MESNLKTKSELFSWSDGRRIVDLQELAKQLHCKQCSSLLDLQRTEREERYGLASVLYIHCACGLLNDVHTSKPQQNSGESRKTPLFEINIKLKASINVLMCGGGSDCPSLSFLALLDIPVPSPSDASLILPPAEEAGVTPPVPSSSPSTLHTVSSSPELSTAAWSSAPQPVVSSGPQVQASVSQDSCASAVQASVSPDDNSVGEEDYRPEYDNPHHNISDEEEEGNDERLCSDGDEEYIPPAKVKLRSKAKPSPARKRKPAPRKSKSASSKSPAKKTKLQGKIKTPKIVLKTIAVESGTKEEGEDTKAVSGEEEEDPGRQGRVEDIDNPMEWSSVESEHDSAGEKVSDNALQEEEQLSKDEGEPRRQRKRGRPRGSTNRAQHKAGQKCEGKVRKDGAQPTGTQGQAGEKKKEAPSCTACAKEFNTVKGYNVHMKKVHNQDMKGVPKRGHSTPEVEAATAEAVSAEIYVCHFCNQPFARDYTVLSHIKHKHWSPTLQPQDCYVTLNLGSTILKMPAKKAKVHGLFSCLHCSSRSMTREVMAAHICIGPQGGLTCVRACPQGKKLGYLEMNYLLTRKQGCLCHTCGDVFKVPVHLDTHLLKVHGVRTERHQRCQCPLCPATFSLPSHLNKHRLLKHPHTPDTHPHPRPPTFMCDLCGKAYDRLDSMMVHRRRHHTEGKRFQCEHCPKTFFGRSHWLNHMRQHFGASKHVCRWCSQQFSSSYALKVHHRRHTGEKPYHCSLCDAAFAQKTSLTLHLKKHQRTQAAATAQEASTGVGGGDVEGLRGSRQKRGEGSGRAGVEAGVKTALCQAEVGRQKEACAESLSGAGGTGRVPPATRVTLDPRGQEKAHQVEDCRTVPAAVLRPHGGPPDHPPQWHVLRKGNSPLSTPARPHSGAQALARLSVPPPARPHTRAGGDRMDTVDASTASATLPLPPPPPPPSLPPPPPSTNCREDLTLGGRGREGVEYGLKAGHAPCLQREGAWLSAPQGVLQPHPGQGGRPQALLGGGRVLEDSRSAPGQGQGQGPTDGGQLSWLGAGGSGQAVFSSFPYPASSFYY